MYVLSGQLRLRLGEHDFVMKPGEAAEFDTRTPHWFGSPGPEPTEVLVLFGPQASTSTSGPARVTGAENSRPGGPTAAVRRRAAFGRRRAGGLTAAGDARHQQGRAGPGAPAR